MCHSILTAVIKHLYSASSIIWNILPGCNIMPSHEIHGEKSCRFCFPPWKLYVVFSWGIYVEKASPMKMATCQISAAGKDFANFLNEILIFMGDSRISLGDFDYFMEVVHGGFRPHPAWREIFHTGFSRGNLTELWDVVSWGGV